MYSKRTYGCHLSNDPCPNLLGCLDFEVLSKKSEDKFVQIQRILSKMDSHEIAHCLESTPSEQRKVIWSIIDKSNEAEVLSELGEEIQHDLFDEISNEELLDLVQNLELDEMVDILQNLPQQRTSFLLSKMTKIDRERVEMVLEYPEDSAGLVARMLFRAAR